MLQWALTSTVNQVQPLVFWFTWRPSHEIKVQSTFAWTESGCIHVSFKGEDAITSGSISVSGQLPTYPSPNPTLTLTVVGLGQLGQFPRYWYWSYQATLRIQSRLERFRTREKLVSPIETLKSLFCAQYWSYPGLFFFNWVTKVHHRFLITVIEFISERIGRRRPGKVKTAFCRRMTRKSKK